MTKSEGPVPRPFVRARRLKRCVERYWLCGDCSAQWTLIYDAERGIALAPLRRPVAGAKTVAVAEQTRVVQPIAS